MDSLASQSIIDEYIKNIIECTEQISKKILQYKELSLLITSNLNGGNVSYEKRVELCDQNNQRNKLLLEILDLLRSLNGKKLNILSCEDYDYFKKFGVIKKASNNLYTEISKCLAKYTV